MPLFRRNSRASSYRPRVTNRVAPRLADYYDPFPRQEEFHRSPAKYRLFGGAAGPGKTKALLWEAILQAHEAPGCDTLLLRRTYPELESSLLAYFRRDVPRWGWNRLAWIGGKFEDRDEQGSLLRECIELRKEPKYPAVNRWHIERWVPPEVYGPPRAWYAQTVELAGGRSIPALGPYPSRGDYEHCFTVEDSQGEFVQLTPTVAERIAQAIEWSRQQPRVT